MLNVLASALVVLLAVLAPPTLLAQTPAAEVTDAANVSLLQVNTDGGFLVRGALGTGAIPASGEGVRLVWFPARAAFRAGYVDAAQWDEPNVGAYSFATGFNTTASGNYATAMGSLATASDAYATAMGYGTRATGYAATALGYYTTAGGYATAMGFATTASGGTSTAIGSETKATGVRSTALGTLTEATAESAIALGNLTYASGINSQAFGYRTYAAGNNSTAMGAYVSTGSNAGTFVVGDASTSTVAEASLPHLFLARFANGYSLATSANFSTGVRAPAGATSWSSISDSTKKTGFVAADGEATLAGLSRLRLGSWSYRGRPADERHYGPMAQDVFREFGRDGRGTIGNDTLLATADVDGVLFVAAQALETRTRAQATRTAVLEVENAALRDRLAALEAVVARLAGSAASTAASTAAAPADRPR